MPRLLRGKDIENETIERCQRLLEKMKVVFSLPLDKRNEELKRLYYDAGVVATGIKRLEEMYSYKYPEWYRFLQRKGFDLIDIVQKNRERYGWWLDHITFLKRGEDECLVSEPYIIGDDALKGILDLCREFDLKVIILGESQHFSGHALRIMITNKGKFGFWKRRFVKRQAGT